MATLNLKIPDSLDEALEAYCEQRGISKTSVVRVAIHDHLARALHTDANHARGDLVQGAMLLEESGTALARGLDALKGFVKLAEKGRKGR